MRTYRHMAYRSGTRWTMHARTASFSIERASLAKLSFCLRGDRPAFMRIPAISLKLLFGSQLADELLLNGQAVLPKVLPEKHGYEFRYPVLRDALQDLVYAKPRDEE